MLSIQWGLPEDAPIVGNYDGGQIPDLVVWRPSNGTWYLLMSKVLYDRNQPVIVQFGLPGDVPIRTDYDGDGRFDLTVWRPSNGTYYYVKSTTAEILTEQWGLPGMCRLTAVGNPVSYPHPKISGQYSACRNIFADNCNLQLVLSSNLTGKSSPGQAFDILQKQESRCPNAIV